MVRITDEARRARLVRRHRLGAGHRANDVVEAVRSVVAFHSTDPVSVFLSAWARTSGFLPADLERALYVDRTLVRMLGMRRTLFVVPRDLVAAVDAACTRAIAAQERRKLERFVAESGFAGDPGKWIEAASRAALEALEARGEAFTTELAGDDPLLSVRLRIGAGTRWETEVSAASRILLLLGAEGAIVRDRPRGSWIGSQYRWMPVDRLGPLERLEPAQARVELLRRYLAAFGPVTEADIRWWTGWSARDTRAALASLSHEVVDLEGVHGYAAEDDVAPDEAPEPHAALLPGLDPTAMGWKERGWYLGPHVGAIFDRNGSAGPTVWWDGRIVGGWTQRPDGEIAYRVLEDVGAAADAAIAAEAERLEDWLGGVRVAPRFRTPLQSELAG